jgi:SET domain-containing protein
VTTSKNSSSGRRVVPRPSTRKLPFELRRSAIQGTGAFATRRIRKGQRLIEYTGERISNAEADRRYDESRMRRHHTFLFTVDRKTVVDGAVDGNEASYINHSCDPNCESVIEDGRIFIYALRTIQPGEEITYDYKYQRSGDPETDAELEDFYRCRCGAGICRGSILIPQKKRRARVPSSAGGAGG